MTKIKSLFIHLFIYSLIFTYANGQVSIDFELFHSGYSQPVEIAAPDDTSDRIFIVEKGGYIYIIENGLKVPTPFLDLHTIVNTENERGLLGLAFHPLFSSNGFFYINYSNSSGNTVISRFSISANNPNQADLSSKKDLIVITQPYKNHNGGDLNFNPLDGFLYIALGDGGSGGDPECYAQDSSSYLGKILRLDVNQNINNSPYYGIPPLNPFINVPSVANEIWAFGLRNPWRFSFDHKTGDLWVADVGQDRREEVNKIDFAYSGTLNFGWKIMEGDTCFDSAPIDDDCPSGLAFCNDESYYPPIFTYPHNEFTGGFSITGGFVYRGCRFPNFYGNYICVDYISRNFWIIDENGSASIYPSAPVGVTSFGEGKNGELYAASILGDIYKIKDTSIESSVHLTNSDYPLDPSYQALDSIKIDLSNINTSLDLIAPVIKLSSNTTLLPGITFNIQEYDCNY